MSSAPFSIPRALQVGWRKLLANPSTFVRVWAFSVIALAIPQVSVVLLDPDEATRRGSAIFLLGGFLFAAIAVWVSLVWFRVALGCIEGREVRLMDLRRDVHLLPRYATASLLYVMVGGARLLPFIVPGLTWISRCALYPFVLLQHDLGPRQSLRASTEVSEGSRRRIFYLLMTFAGINLLGLTALLIGFLVTCPVTVLAFAHVYRDGFESGVSDTAKVMAEGASGTTRRQPEEGSAWDDPCRGKEGAD